jgi:hypothetical protein
MAVKLLFLVLVYNQFSFFVKEDVLGAGYMNIKQDSGQSSEFHFYVRASNRIIYNLDTLSKEELFEAIYQHILEFGSSHSLFFHTFTHTDYAIYVDIQNQINLIYKRLRNEKSSEVYNLLYIQLSEEQKGIIKQYVPLRLFHKLETDG